MSYEYNLGLGTENGSTDEEETLFEQGWEWFREVAAAKDSQPVTQQPAPMPGATSSGKPSPAGFSSYAREAAIREVAVVDEETAPFQETSPEEEEEVDERTGIERYQTHITLISTIVGLGTFIVWLLIRKKDQRR